LPLKTAALSVRREAGNPNWLAPPRNVSSASAALTVVNATDATKRREWSSTKFRISTLAPSARCHSVASACQRSLGRLASKRTKEERGRLCGCGVIKPRRRRMRQMVVREGGDDLKRPARWWAMVWGPAS
jgi:hypothetical protein